MHARLAAGPSVTPGSYPGSVVALHICSYRYRREEDQGAADREEDLGDTPRHETSGGYLRARCGQEGYDGSSKDRAHDEPDCHVGRRPSPRALTHPAERQPETPVFQPLYEGDQER